MHVQGTLIVVQKLEPMRFVFGIAGLQAEAHADQTTRAGRGHAAQRIQRQAWQAAISAHFVQGGSQVRRGVGKSAVQVKQYAVDHGIVVK